MNVEANEVKDSVKCLLSKGLFSFKSHSEEGEGGTAKCDGSNKFLRDGGRGMVENSKN